MRNRNLVARCKERGFDFCYMTIYRHGIKEGFIHKNEVGQISFNDVVFERWLDKMSEKIPDDCEYISDAVRRTGIKYSYFSYYIFKECKKVSRDNMGRKYADRIGLERIIERYNKNVIGKERKSAE